MDYEPIEYILELIKNQSNVIVCDLGCGTGRYSLPLLKASNNIHKLYGIDVNEKMLRMASRHAILQKLFLSTEWFNASSDKTIIGKENVDVVTAFNSFHHLPFEQSIKEAYRILKPLGKLVIYSRTKDQESEHIWGKYFPGYMKYSQVLDRETFRSIGDNKLFRLHREIDYHYQRKVSFGRIWEQTCNKHYSTLDLYPEEEFGAVLLEFPGIIFREYSDTENIEYQASNTLFVYDRL